MMIQFLWVAYMYNLYGVNLFFFFSWLKVTFCCDLLQYTTFGPVLFFTLPYFLFFFCLFLSSLFYFFPFFLSFFLFIFRIFWHILGHQKYHVLSEQQKKKKKIQYLLVGDKRQKLTHSIIKIVDEVNIKIVSCNYSPII